MGDWPCLYVQGPSPEPAIPAALRRCGAGSEQLGPAAHFHRFLWNLTKSDSLLLKPQVLKSHGSLFPFFALFGDHAALLPISLQAVQEDGLI